MKFLADESVDFPIVRLLRQNHQDVLSILEDHQSALDDFILNLADKENRVLITLDKDFGELVYRLKMNHSGVLLVRLDGVKPTVRAEKVLQTIQQHGNELANAFTVIQLGMTRIRKSF